MRKALRAAVAALLCATSWASAQDIIIGQSAATSGPAQALGQQMQQGIEAYFKQVNDAGGVTGRKLVLKTLDDGYEPDRAAANTRQLIEKDNAFALLGYVGTPTSQAALPIFTSAKVPFVGAFTGAELLRTPFNRYVFNVRASYFDETEEIVRHLTTLSINRIAVFYQNDAYGKAGLEGVTRALERRNLKVISLGTVERNTVDVAAAVASIGKSEAQAVVLISAYKSCAAFIRAMKAEGKNPTFWNVSFVGSKALANELGTAARGVQISQVVPFPWDATLPVVKQYQAAIAAVGGDINFSSLEGYLAAKVLVEGMRKAGRKLTRESLVEALESMQAHDLGGFKVSYSDKSHNGSKFVDLTIISKDGKFKR